MINIHLDLDGVLADMHSDYEQRFGKKIHDVIPPKEFWNNIGTVDNYFYHLPKKPKAKLLFRFLRSIPNSKLSILSGIPIPRGKLSTAALDKEKWVHKYFSSSITVNTIVGGKNKYQYIAPGNICILIDDMQRNIDNWREAGGIGILHTDVYDTITQMHSVLDLETHPTHYFEDSD